MKPVIQIKRVYDKALKKDGYRVLVDRLWPRGISKAVAAVDEWAKEIAPTPTLRKWFSHDPERWSAFKKRYLAELKANNAIEEFVEQHEDKPLLTLVYGAKDTEHTHALVLQEYLNKRYKA